MKTTYLKSVSVFIILVVLTASCTDRLDTVPLDEDVTTSEVVYKNVTDYKQVLAKVYAGLAVSGQQGPAGKPDISGIDEGFSTYLRQFWKAQELTTDEAVIAWNDGNLRDYQEMDWSSTNEFVTAMYNRIYYQIALTNVFILEAGDGKLSNRGISGTDREEVQMFRREARFMRALSYWHALDMYGSVPFVTEEDGVGAFFPEQISKVDLFNYIESELKDIEAEMVAPGLNEYGRADQGAVWFLLAKLYLNAEVYINEPRYTECLTYCEKIINSNAYQLADEYAYNFLSDNYLSPELIFTVNFDGKNTQTWGGMTFLVHAAVGGSMDITEFGIDGGWGGLRTTPEFVDQFDDISGNTDSRAMFHTDGQNLEIDNMFTFTDGYAITKYKNVNRNGVAGSDLVFPDTDYPLFRYADVYLMYAEAQLRGGGGDAGLALAYVNELRERAYGGNSGNIGAANLTLDFILEERARELYWEGHRRTDLVRYNLLTGSDYLWSWKGGVQQGRGADERYDQFPLPASDVAANPNLEQNPAYR
jgi:starch-binding outer membrane protein, SusD/RagB family